MEWWKLAWTLADWDVVAIIHVIGGLLLIGYAQNYYFHLRKCYAAISIRIAAFAERFQATTRTTLTRGSIRCAQRLEARHETEDLYIDCEVSDRSSNGNVTNIGLNSSSFVVDDIT
jgi:hypothetical protein